VEATAAVTPACARQSGDGGVRDRLVHHSEADREHDVATDRIGEDVLQGLDQRGGARPMDGKATLTMVSTTIEANKD